MAYHGQPRYTGDLDLFFRPSPENASALLDTLRDFGAPTRHLRLDELAVRGFTVTFDVPPSRIDLLNWLSGVEYDDAASDAEEGELGGVPIRFLSRRVLLKNKAAAARPKDLFDAQVLNSEGPDPTA
jgi:hypothetical protein